MKKLLIAVMLALASSCNKAQPLPPKPFTIPQVKVVYSHQEKTCNHKIKACSYLTYQEYSLENKSDDTTVLYLKCADENMPLGIKPSQWWVLKPHELFTFAFYFVDMVESNPSTSYCEIEQAGFADFRYKRVHGQ